MSRIHFDQTIYVSATEIGGSVSAKLLGGLSKDSPKFCGEKVLWLALRSINCAFIEGGQYEKDG
jgi:hypothetical protein